MGNETVKVGCFTGLPTTLFVTFLILKLTGTVDWSWWGVTAPLWVPVAFWALMAMVAVMLGVIVKMLK